MKTHIPNAWLRERTGKHRSTITRWRLAGRLPPELVRLARLELDGELGLIHDKWAGWKIHPKTGELVSPGGECYTAGEIQCIPLQHQRIRALELECVARRRARLLEWLRAALMPRRGPRRAAAAELVDAERGRLGPRHPTR